MLHFVIVTDYRMSAKDASFDTVVVTDYRVSAKDASFELRLHLIYLINDILHHWLVFTLSVYICHHLFHF